MPSATPPTASTGIDGRAHLIDVVEGIEDTKEIDPCGLGLLDESGHYGIGRCDVADGVTAAQQHLEHDVRSRVADADKSVPWVLVKGIEGPHRRWPLPNTRG